MSADDKPAGKKFLGKAAAFTAWEGTVFGSVPKGYAKTRAWFRKTFS